MGKVGYSSITLTDITETIPFSLVLQSNSGGVQTKRDNKYTPNFEEEGLIITPLLYQGSVNVGVPIQKDDENGVKGVIHYEITGEGEDPFTYENTSDTNKIYVDIDGKLHYNKNLEQSITIEAYITNYKDDAHGYEVESIPAGNRIDIYFLSTSSQYEAIATASRNFFNDSNPSHIDLTARLYYEGEEKTDNISYEWDKASDTDDGTENDFKRETSETSIERTDVSNVDVFQCKITYDGSTYYTNQVIIYDLLDTYNCNLIANNPLILTPNNTTIALTNQVYNSNGEVISEGITYEWAILKKGNTTATWLTDEYGETKQTLEIDIINKEPFSEIKENFSIVGKATVNGKITVSNFINIAYQPVAYTVEVSPRQIFIPVNSVGEYSSDNEFTSTLTFKLVDDSKQCLNYEEKDSSIPSISEEDKDRYDFSLSQKEGIWDFSGELKIPPSEIKGLGDVTNLNIQYTYLDNPFTETIQLIKNYAGAAGPAGTSGTPGYNVYLSNSFHMFSGGELIARPDQKVNFSVLGFYGSEQLKVTSIKIGKSFDKAVSINYGREISEGDAIKMEDIDGLRLYYKWIDKTIECTLKTFQDSNESLQSTDPIYVFATFSDNEGETKLENIQLSFNYSINNNGDSYSLAISENQIIWKIAENKFNVDNFTVKAYYRAGGVGDNIEYSGKITYAIDDGKEKGFTGETFETNNNENLSSSNSRIKFNLYSGTSLLDTQTIPILTSFENVEIGGENLLNGTGELLLGEDTESWNGENVENKVREITFPETSDGKLNSPYIDYNDSYFTRNFCLSFSLNAKEGYSFSVYISFKDEELPSRELDNISYIPPSFSYEQNIRVYYIFQLKDNETSAFRFTFSGKNCVFFEPKLELGNIPTEWCPSEDDRNNSIIESIGETSNKIEDLKTTLLSKITESSKIPVSNLVEGINVISGFNDSGEMVIEEKELSGEIFTIHGADGEEYSIIGLDAFKNYVNELNINNAKQIANYSTTLISTSLSEYKSSIVISPAHINLDDGTAEEGNITIKTSYIKTSTNTDTEETITETAYAEALRLTSNKISFLSTNDDFETEEVAYISNKQFFIKEGQITETLILGPDNKGEHLKIYAKDNSIAVVWE